MASDNKKKVAALIVAGMPAPGKGKPAPMDEEDKMDGGADDDQEAKDAAEESAFADFRVALKGDDKTGLAAFKELLEACGYSKGE